MSVFHNVLRTSLLCFRRPGRSLTFGITRSHPPLLRCLSGDPWPGTTCYVTWCLQAPETKSRPANNNSELGPENLFERPIAVNKIPAKKLGEQKANQPWIHSIWCLYIIRGEMSTAPYLTSGQIDWWLCNCRWEENRSDLFGKCQVT